MPGSSGALTLYIAHRAELVNYANRIVGDHARAEDVVQEAWLRFDAAFVAGLFEEPVAYLYRVVRNLSIDRRRRMTLEARFDGGEVGEVTEGIADETPSPENVAVARSELDMMYKAIAELPERTRIAMEMHRFGGCKIREIAAYLGISTSRAHALIMEGLTRCRARLDEAE